MPSTARIASTRVWFILRPLPRVLDVSGHALSATARGWGPRGDGRPGGGGAGPSGPAAGGPPQRRSPWGMAGASSPPDSATPPCTPAFRGGGPAAPGTGGFEVFGELGTAAIATGPFFALAAGRPAGA